MKTTKLFLTLAAGLLLTVAPLCLLAADKAVGKKMTITGMAMCAKCALHLTDKCQTVIQTKENGKTVTYWVTPNEVAKAFHRNICLTSEKVTATGTVHMQGGKDMLTVTKIEPVKQK